MSVIEIKFIEINSRRAMRGADAARMEIIENGDKSWMWMNLRDIEMNLKKPEFKDHPQLIKAKLAYSCDGLS